LPLHRHRSQLYIDATFKISSKDSQKK
jgi:hypothetical protein